MALKATRPQGPMVPNQGPMVLKAAIPQGPMVLKPAKPRENAERTAFISGHHADPDSLWTTILSSAQGILGQRFQPGLSKFVARRACLRRLEIEFISKLLPAPFV
jgi:hypothetical protein